MSIKSRIKQISAVSMLAFCVCHSQAATKAAGSAADAVVATVNGVPIHTSRIDLIVNQRMAQGQQDTPELRNAIIENLALQQMISEVAVKKGLDKTLDTTNQMELAKVSVLTNAFVQDYIKNNPVTEEMLKAEYEKIKAQESGNEYKARHILVEKEADANAILAALKKDPNAFDKLAKEKSIDTGTKDHGGDLGWFDARAMVPEFTAAVVKLEKGKLTTEPVKSQFGYHIIMLEDTRPKQIPSLDQIRDKLTQFIQKQNLQKAFEDIKAKGKVEIVSVPASAPTVAAKK